MEDKLSSAAELPYFEGDFWPNVLEESIKELDQEEEEKRKQAEAAEAAANAVSYNKIVPLFYTCPKKIDCLIVVLNSIRHERFRGHPWSESYNSALNQLIVLGPQTSQIWQ